MVDERPVKRARVEDEDQNKIDAARNEVYLETVDRSKLEFDKIQMCSVTLRNLNLYSCLVCGKFYEGRSKSTSAYYHSVEGDHHVFMNLKTLKVYILPDGYENTNTALDDIKYACQPTFTKQKVAELDTVAKQVFDLTRKSYRPGFVGLNSRKGFEYIGAVVHALAHIVPIRNFFLLENLDGKPDFVQAFATLLRKLWSSRLLRAHVSPFDFMRLLTASTKGKDFSKDLSHPQEFMTTLLNRLHHALGGSSKSMSLISMCLQGTLKVETQRVYAVNDRQAGDRVTFHEDTYIETKALPFMFLTLDLPLMPLFQDEVQKNFIPQIPITELLQKYNGLDVKEMPGQRQRYSITKLPPFLVIYIKRFPRNDSMKDRNATIVNFPIKSLDMRPCKNFDD